MDHVLASKRNNEGCNNLLKSEIKRTGRSHRKKWNKYGIDNKMRLKTSQTHISTST